MPVNNFIFESRRDLLGAVELPRNIQEQLLVLAETGMDYQTGDITLASGQVVRDCIFISGQVTKVEQTLEPFFNTNEVKSISLTHKKWSW
jgi:hypothetical protein